MVKGLAIKRRIYCSFMTILGVGFACVLAKFLSMGSGDSVVMAICALGVIGSGAVVVTVAKRGRYA